MRVHHLNCGTVRPYILTGVCHVLLCETAEGLVLVDSGFGLADHREPGRRLGPIRHVLRPVADESLTAVRQLEALGFEAGDVAHIVATHLDLDHIGGSADFPEAVLHTTADEHAAALTGPDFLDKRRYRPVQFDHGPRFALYEGPGDLWRDGLTGHEVVPGVTVVPMPGHSRGHAAVAVERGDGHTIVHAGDAVFDASLYASTTPDGEPLERVRALRAFEQVVGRDRAAIARNHRTLAALHAHDDVTVVNAHDPRVFDSLPH